MRQGISLIDDVKSRLAHSRCQRIATKRAAVCARSEARCHFISGQHRANWETRTQGFGRRHNVRHHIVMLVREQFARASHACLHFIQHQQGIVLITQATGGL